MARDGLELLSIIAPPFPGPAARPREPGPALFRGLSRGSELAHDRRDQRPVQTVTLTALGQPGSLPPHTRRTRTCSKLPFSAGQHFSTVWFQLTILNSAPTCSARMAQRVILLPLLATRFHWGSCPERI